MGKLGFENVVSLGIWESEVLEMGGVWGGRSCSPNAPRLDESPEEIPGPFRPVAADSECGEQGSMV